MNLRKKVAKAYTTQAEFAKDAGVHPRTVRRWIEADHIPLWTVAGLEAYDMLERRLKK